MPLWIDTDMGFDDLMAILLLEHAALKIDGLSLVAGNAPIEQVSRNAAAAAQCFGWRGPIHVGAARPIRAEPETAASILGETGMQSAGQQLPNPDEAAMSERLQTDVISALARWLERVDTPATILALGPLTNIAAFSEKHRDLTSRISRLVWMGGSAGAGNHTPHAEFNAYVDPEAIDIVLKAGLPLHMVGLDVCRTVTMNSNDIAGLRRASGKNAGLLADLLEGYIQIALTRGRDAMAVYDPTAAAAIADPSAVDFIPARVHVHPSGTEKRGMTEIDFASRSLSNMLLANHADNIRVRTLTLHGLQTEAAR